MFYFNCILLIDDDPIANELHEALLRQFYFSDEIKSVFNAEQAFEFINEFVNRKGNFPELILLDINMPGMDGFQFVEKLNTLPYADKDTFKISALTSSSDVRDQEFMKALGVKHYIIKPLSPAKIRELVYKRENNYEL